MAVTYWHARVLGHNEAVPTDPTVVIIPLDDNQPDKLRSNVERSLQQAGLTLPPSALDLYRLAAAVFACDVRMPRNTAFDGWTRHIHLSLPVADPVLWAAAAPRVTELLRYLSGDEWELEFRAHPSQTLPAAAPVPVTKAIFQPDAICLLSGGMDSFIGAADKLAAGLKLTLVSHYGAGSAQHAGPAQTFLKNLLQQAYPQQVREFTFNVDPRQGLTGLSESTTRSRSLVFMSLGTLVAKAQQASRLFIPENGLITLNIPLNYSRLGSSSTRTTHPYTLYLFQQVVQLLGLGVTIENPYRYLTKGEMLAGVRNPALVHQGLPHTMSCAHPNAARFKRMGVGHCGYCVPCIIRASAEHRAGLNGTPHVLTYAHDVRRRVRPAAGLTDRTGGDVRAFEMAISRAHQKAPGVGQVSQAGPLSSDTAHLADYVRVYTQGLSEVDAFFAS